MRAFVPVWGVTDFTSRPKICRKSWLTWASFRMETLALLQYFTNCLLQLAHSDAKDRLKSYVVGCPLGEIDFAVRVTYGTGCGRGSLESAGSIQS
jgi:hypothetical protein